MGNIHSCTSKGALLLVAAANGDLVTAQELLARHPKAASYYNFKDRSSPLIQAAARGHFELVQLILETAVMTEGPERAKKNCIDHANSKRQTALMVACKHGHPDCVEYLVTNGGDPLLTDERRHNTCLHFAALYGHSECVHKLLGSRAAYRVQGRQVPVAQIPCVDDGVNIKFIDRHNGWGLSALHIAVFQGSVSTVRALLRHGADVESVICASKVENSPIRCAVGSNALHIAALTGNIVMAKLILETQESYPGLELRSRTNAAGLKPHDYAQSARNPVLMHLLDERLPVTLLRQIWMNYSLEQSLPPRTQTLGSMLQKLKLMFNLELIAIQRNVMHLQAQQEAAAALSQQALQQQQQLQHGGAQTASGEQVLPQRLGAAGAAATGVEPIDVTARSALSLAPVSISTVQAGAGGGGMVSMGAHGGGRHRSVEPANVRMLWARRQEEITQLLATVTQLHDNLKQLCRRDEPAAGEGAEAAGVLNRADRAGTYEAVLDFILSTLITPRTVSAILHAAKKLVSASVTGTAALTAGGAPMELPPGDSDSQHGLALLSTALRAVETCLQAAVFLTSPTALEQQVAAAESGRFGTAAATGGAAAGALPGSDVPGSDPVVAAGTGAPAPPADAGAGAAEGAGNHPGDVLRTRPDLAGNRSVEGANTPLGAAGGQGSAALVSDPITDAHGVAQDVLQPQGSPRVAAVGALGPGTMSINNPGLIFQSAAAIRGVGDGTSTTPAFAAHWSAHLHTLIAQLQWDIGVQRHRRRRAHAAAAAARSAAAAVVAANASAANGNSGTPTHAAGVPVAGAAPAGAVVPAAAAANAALAASAHGAVPGNGAAQAVADAAGGASTVVGTPAGPGPADSETAAAGGGAGTVNLLRVLNSRRGDAVQDVVTSQSGTAPNVAPLAQSRSDSGLSTPVGTAAAQAAAGAQAAGAVNGSEARANTPGPRTAPGEDVPLQNQTGIHTDEIIPLVSGVLPTSRAHSPVARLQANGAQSPIATPAAAAAAAAAEDHLTTRGMTASTAAAAAKRGGVAKDRGKERDGTAAGDGGLDGQDDSPAASESGSDWSDDDRNVCSICMDLPVAVLVAGCQHGLCVQCAFQLCVKGRELPSCPFCRQKIGGFEAKDMGGNTATAMAAAPGAAAAAAPAGVAAGQAGPVA